MRNRRRAMTARRIIASYRLGPHPEGGWYREIHRSRRTVGRIAGYPGDRVALTAIHFLLTRDVFSAFHRLRSEEVWVHLAGAPMEIVFLGKTVRRSILAPLSATGEPVVFVPAGTIQAARTLGDYTLVICLVAPGFEFADFALMERKRLLRNYPGHAALIEEQTR